MHPDATPQVLFGTGKHRNKAADQLGVAEAEIAAFEHTPKAYQTLGVFDHGAHTNSLRTTTGDGTAIVGDSPVHAHSHGSSGAAGAVPSNTSPHHASPRSESHGSAPGPAASPPAAGAAGTAAGGDAGTVLSPSHSHQQHHAAAAKAQNILLGGNKRSSQNASHKNKVCCARRMFSLPL